MARPEASNWTAWWMVSSMAPVSPAVPVWSTSLKFTPATRSRVEMVLGTAERARTVASLTITGRGSAPVEL